ncbi:hypothetical protein BGZ60DRAFT_404234 [Tricladium varicosporioides]|nr:hypothetical protein BGZ60DRAFT_404234 [Hymenoscyphus varicosporioides]
MSFNLPLPAPERSKPPPITTTPVRPRHQVTRSITELSTNFPKLHRSHHHHHRRHQSYKDKEATPFSAVPDLQINGEQGVMSEGTTPIPSGDVSRRTSVLGVSRDDEEKEKERRVVREGQVAAERERGAQRALELRNATLDLNTLSNNTTRRLDMTYYSVLEKLSFLQNTLSSMKELAQMSKNLNEEFHDESEGVVADVTRHLEGFDQFQQQERRISSLADRVKQGREKINTLAGRVNIVRERVEGWERANAEWQDRTRKRLKTLWVIMSVMAGVFAALALVRYAPARSMIQDTVNDTNITTKNFSGKTPDFDQIRNETWKLKRKSTETLDGLLDKGGVRLDDDPRLRLFDEL